MKNAADKYSEICVNQPGEARSAELDHLSKQHRVYSHLDWWQIDEWFHSDAFSCALQNDHVIAALLIVPVVFSDINKLSSAQCSAAWLRWCAVADDASGSNTLKTLFDYSEAQCAKAGISTIYAVVEPGQWINHYLIDHDYHVADEVVTMIYRGEADLHLPLKQKREFIIRNADARDLSQVCGVDASSFSELWRFPLFVLDRAVESSVYFTVAECDGQVVGYQMTTIYDGDAHITRLAVHPDSQRRGFGSALLTDTIKHMKLWYDARNITLNTQASNLISQHLYERYGFVSLTPHFRVMHKSLSSAKVVVS